MGDSVRAATSQDVGVYGESEPGPCAWGRARCRLLVDLADLSTLPGMTNTPSGASYAWLPPCRDFVEPVRAVPLTNPDPRRPLWDAVALFYEDFPRNVPSCAVTLHHPDLGEIPALVALQDLRGRWDEEPPLAFVEATGWNPGRTWAQVAEDRYAWTVEVRALADRLTRLGIPRARRHYAGLGGTSVDTRRQLDTTLALQNSEMLQLVSLAERGNT